MAPERMIPKQSLRLPSIRAGHIHNVSRVREAGPVEVIGHEVKSYEAKGQEEKAEEVKDKGYDVVIPNGKVNSQEVKSHEVSGYEIVGSEIKGDAEEGQVDSGGSEVGTETGTEVDTDSDCNTHGHSSTIQIHKKKKIHLYKFFPRKQSKVDQIKEETFNQRAKDIQRIKYGIRQKIKEQVSLPPQPKRHLVVHNSLTQSDSEVELSRHNEHSRNQATVSFLTRLRKRHRAVMPLDSLSPRKEKEKATPRTTPRMTAAMTTVSKPVPKRTWSIDQSISRSLDHKVKHTPNQPVTLTDHTTWDYEGREEDLEQLHTSYTLPRIEEVLRAEGIKPQSITQQIERLKMRCKGIQYPPVKRQLPELDPMDKSRLYKNNTIQQVTAKARQDLEDFLKEIERTRWLSHQQMEAGNIGREEKLPRLVIVASNVANSDMVVSSVVRQDDTVLPICYDFDESTYNNLLDTIHRTLQAYREGCKARSLLLLCQGGPGHLYMVKRKVVTPQKLSKKKNIDLISFWKDLSNLMTKTSPDETFIHIISVPHQLAGTQGIQLIRQIHEILYPNIVHVDAPDFTTSWGREVIELYMDFSKYREWVDHIRTAPSETSSPTLDSFRESAVWTSYDSSLSIANSPRRMDALVGKKTVPRMNTTDKIIHEVSNHNVPEAEKS